MPEEKGRSSSGWKPEEKTDTLRPTVPDWSSVAPRSKASTPVVPAPTTTSVAKPTAMPGVERKRIPVEQGDLRKLSPGFDTSTYEEALRLLYELVLEKMTERKAIMWGIDLQKSHSDLVTQTLTLSQNPLLRKVEGYLNRMMDILGSIDLMAVCGHGSGGLGQLLKGVNNKIDTPEELKAAQAELDMLVKFMSTALNELLDLKDAFEQHSSKLNEVAARAEAHAVAALFLSQYLQKEKAGLAQRFTQRSMSLTQTLAQIRGDSSMRKVQIEQPIRLVGAIQNVVLVLMPGFIGSIASMTTALAGRNGRVSPTEAGELNYQLRNIIGKLQSN